MLPFVSHCTLLVESKLMTFDPPPTVGFQMAPSNGKLRPEWVKADVTLKTGGSLAAAHLRGALIAPVQDPLLNVSAPPNELISNSLQIFCSVLIEGN